MKKVNTKSLSLFFENLSFLIDAGIDPLTAVTTLDDGADKQTGSITKLLIKELTDGKDLSQAFEKYKSFFRNDSYSVYIAAGLKSGELQTVLSQMAKNLTMQAGVQKQIAGALMYPAFLLILTVFVSMYMFTSIVPQIGKNIQEVSGAELPRITQLAMGISDFLINRKFVLLGGTFVVFISLKFLFSVFRMQLSKIATRIPIVGRLIVQMDMGNFYTNLAHMLCANIPISDCLSVCAGGLKNRYMKNQITKQTNKHNERGSSLKDFVSSLTFTSPSERQCIVVAESTGKLAEMFSKIAERKQNELQQTIKTMLTMVEPAMLLIMGGVIGSIVFAVYMPILSMSNF